MTEAQDLTFALGGRWHGRYGAAPCPVCQPERRKGQNALTLGDGDGGRLVLHCKKTACHFLDILCEAGVRAGDYRPPDPETLARREADRRGEAYRKAEQARRLWQEAQPIAGTIAEAYLRGRGLTCHLPPTLRFHSEAWHGPTARRWPALVAAVQGAGATAVHRTWLRADGLGKADIDPAKAMLGATGGGAVRLSQGPSRLVVAEGIESSLSLMCGLLDGPATVWAALSTSGMRGLNLPTEPGWLTIATDSDDGGAGHLAGHALAERAHALGWQVSLLPAPVGFDWNDYIQGKAVEV